MKKFFIGTIAGGIAFFLLGGLIYAVLLRDFYAANLGSATGVMRDLPILWAMVVSQLGMGALVTWLFLNVGVTTALDGLKTGAVFGLLFGIAVSLDLYSVTNWSNMTVALVEPFVTGGRIALVGAFIGWTLGWGSRN